MPSPLSSALQFVRTNDLKAILAKLNARDTHPAIQFLKYSISGGAAVIVYASVYFALVFQVWPELRHLGTDTNVDWMVKFTKTLPPTGIAFFFSNIVVYWINTRWVFTPGRHHPVAEFLFFTLVNMPGAIGGSVVQGLLIAKCGWSAGMAFLGFLVPNILINYVCRKFFIFKG
jgi:putative flippase GtrA